MPISLLVFSFISILGAVSGAALLADCLGLIVTAGPATLWTMFLVFSLLGPAGVMMAGQRPGGLLIALGLSFTALGLVALSAVFGVAVGAMSLVPTSPLLFLGLLTLPGGLGLVAAGRTASVA